jgi:predicted ribosome-associated RNA-binding protein Tma20
MLELRVAEVGVVRLNHIAQVVDQPDAKVWSIDCHTKYAQVAATYGDEEVEILLYDDERTLHKADTTKPTVLDFKYPEGENWQVLIDGGRYSFTVAAFKWDERNARQVWSAEE